MAFLVTALYAVYVITLKCWYGCPPTVRLVMFAFVAVRLGVVIFVEVRLAADSLEVADKFANTPFVAFMLLLTSSPVACILSN